MAPPEAAVVRFLHRKRQSRRMALAIMMAAIILPLVCHLLQFEWNHHPPSLVVVLVVAIEDYLMRGLPVVDEDEDVVSVTSPHG